jgi:hypothetical protein
MLKKETKKQQAYSFLIPFETMNEKKENEKIWINTYARFDDEFPDCIVFFDGNSQKSKVLAVLNVENQLHIRNPNWSADFEKYLKLFEKDPKSFIPTIGKKVGICLLCGRSLTNENSFNLGYGPDCAKYINYFNFV